MVVLLPILVTAISVLAAAPTEGTVIEGHSVPGVVALVDTWAQVEAAYSQPASCKNSDYLDGRQGLNVSCEFHVDGGGWATVNFLGPDGGPAQASPDNEVYSISWEQGVSKWVTTAGINTTAPRANLYPLR